MTNFRFHTAAAAIALGVGLCTLGAQVANAANVPLVNANFSGVTSTGELTGWTSNVADVPDGIAFIRAFTDGEAVDNGLGIFNYAQLQCTGPCPGSFSNSVSQSVGSLINGDRYRFSVYAMGVNNPGDGTGLKAAAPLTIQLGGQTSGPITVPTNTGVGTSPWQRQTFDFTYTGSGSSALLSLFQNFSDLNLSCEPCAETMWLANASLQDITDTGGPNPQVAEPSSLLTAALGIGMLGLYMRRRNSTGR
jgi:hypothetical protein